MLKKNVLLFASAKERVGATEVSLELTAEGETQTVTAGYVMERLGMEYPCLLDLLPSCRLAVNCEYVSEASLVPLVDSEFALIPPVSGG